MGFRLSINCTLFDGAQPDRVAKFFDTVMEMGVDGVLMNTAIALARDPRMMAEAMRDGVRAGRMAFLAGRMPRKLYASASSPLDGVIGRPS